MYNIFITIPPPHPLKNPATITKTARDPKNQPKTPLKIFSEIPIASEETPVANIINENPKKVAYPLLSIIKITTY